MTDSSDDFEELLRTVERVEYRKNAPRAERDFWLDAARRSFLPGQREPCVVCGKFFGITQAHHVVPLTAQYDRGFRWPDGEFVWLCPNHHAIVHLFILADNRSFSEAAFRARSRTTSALYADITNVEFEILLDIAGKSGRTP